MNMFPGWHSIMYVDNNLQLFVYQYNYYVKLDSFKVDQKQKCLNCLFQEHSENSDTEDCQFDLLNCLQQAFALFLIINHVLTHWPINCNNLCKISIVDHITLSYRIFDISATERTCPLESWHYVRSSDTATGCSGFTSYHCLSLNNESTSGNNIDEIQLI